MFVVFHNLHLFWLYAINYLRQSQLVCVHYFCVEYKIETVRKRLFRDDFWIMFTVVKYRRWDKINTKNSINNCKHQRMKCLNTNSKRFFYFGAVDLDGLVLVWEPIILLIDRTENGSTEEMKKKINYTTMYSRWNEKKLWGTNNVTTEFKAPTQQQNL